MSNRKGIEGEANSNIIGGLLGKIFGIDHSKSGSVNTPDNGKDYERINNSGKEYKKIIDEAKGGKK